MNLKTLNVVTFLIGCILIYSAYRNKWPHLLVAKSLGRDVKPEDMHIDPDNAVKGWARPMDPVPPGGGAGPPQFASIPWTPNGGTLTGGTWL